MRLLRVTGAVLLALIAAAPAAAARTPSAPAAAARTPSAPAAAARTRSPTRAQISHAVAHAERSRLLWATVNICNTRRHPNTIGVRGQMPALGFASWLSMRVQVDYWSGAAHGFVPVPDADRLLRLGRWRSNLHQGGVTFSFPSHTGYLDATVQFIWRREGRLLGETARPTTGGHPTADYGDPPHYSAMQCYIS